VVPLLLLPVLSLLAVGLLTRFRNDDVLLNATGAMVAGLASRRSWARTTALPVRHVAPVP
jgi:hypothetical protein